MKHTIFPKATGKKTGGFAIKYFSDPASDAQYFYNTTQSQL